MMSTLPKLPLQNNSVTLMFHVELVVSLKSPHGVNESYLGHCPRRISRYCRICFKFLNYLPQAILLANGKEVGQDICQRQVRTTPGYQGLM